MFGLLFTQSEGKMPETPSQLLQQHFGFSEFRPGQEVVIEALHTHKAALAVFPTGAGKSLCYQLPALRYDGLTLVVSPLIALMKDQIDFLQSHGIAAARLDSTLSGEEARNVTERMEAGTLKLLYVAPERFNNERFLSLLGRVSIALFAVDEAHCISEWGHNFRPDYLKLATAARSVGAERTLALTATATPAVVQDICAAFQIPKEAAIVTGLLPAQSQCQHHARQSRRPRRAIIEAAAKTRPWPNHCLCHPAKNRRAGGRSPSGSRFPCRGVSCGSG